MGKAVINTCYGGFSLSQEAYSWLYERGFKYVHINPNFKEGSTNYGEREKYIGNIYALENLRHHPLLVECVETLGEESYGMFSRLSIEEFPGTLYKINNYDGCESIEYPFIDKDWIDTTKLECDEDEC